jgi:ribosomal protein S18 acetylase RimI-like enzyme
MGQYPGQGAQTRIREIEEVAADAVPAAVVERLGGWRLRFNHGVKRRPNSVLANRDDDTLDTETKIGRAEAFYAAHGLRARFQLSPASVPGALDALLAGRGYLRVPESVCVQVAALGALPNTVSASATGLALLSQPSEAWLELLCETEGLTGAQEAALREMLGKLPGEAVFAFARDRAGRPAAAGVGVAHGGLLGLFNIATHPRARRQGLASAVVTSLCSWGRERGLTRAYLQVSEGNTGAQTVYQKLGFRTLYEYFYREQP